MLWLFNFIFDFIILIQWLFILITKLISTRILSHIFQITWLTVSFHFFYKIIQVQVFICMEFATSVCFLVFNNKNNVKLTLLWDFYTPFDQVFSAPIFLHIFAFVMTFRVWGSSLCGVKLVLHFEAFKINLYFDI